MKKKAIIAIATLLSFGQVAWAQTTSFPRHGETGENSESNPYIIESIEDLNALAADVNSGTDYSGVYFQLTDDLDYKNNTFTPIGYGDDSDGKPFSGTFDGNGKTITGITVNTSDAWGVGLFGFISKATIKNLTITESSFIANGFVGAIAGSSAGVNNHVYPIIENCHVTGSVTVSATDFGAGGIIGIDNDNLTIKDCTSAAMVTSSDPNSRPGGIIGVAYDDDVMATIVDSYYLGDMRAIGENGGQRGHVTINITLLNDDSGEGTVKNATRISNYNGETANVTLSGRTLSKSEWNTLCLPFSMDATQIAAGSLNGATIKELNAENSNLATNGTLTLTFSDVSSITAGKPYIVKWGSGDDISDPVFEGVTIDETAPAAVTFTNNANDNGDCKFVGQYSPFSITDGNKNEIIMLGSGSKLGYSRNERTLKCFRAHFYVPANGGGALARAFVMDFGDGETTEIIGATADQRSASATYTLDGRRINDLPTQKGMYIQNGRKVIIK